ncbi:hypothetical protein ACQJBY_045847 [Aegilops geniculata]
MHANKSLNPLVFIPGIQVHITLHHLDPPQILEDEYGGWLSPRIIEDFTAYADVCFREFGDRIASWTTVNEPNIGILASYDVATFPLGCCSDPFGATKCTAGDSTVEPYIAAHNTLMAHASAVSLYRKNISSHAKRSYWHKYLLFLELSTDKLHCGFSCNSEM